MDLAKEDRHAPNAPAHCVRPVPCPLPVPDRRNPRRRGSGDTGQIPIQGGEKRWPLVEPTFDGETFSFKVDNGETLLAGEMRLVGEGFEGSWKDAGGEDGGRLTMTRKAT